MDVDALARTLAHAGHMGRRMEPSWRAHGDVIPFGSANGVQLGQVWPGHGLVLDVDLKWLGITRRIPHVYSRTVARRALEVLFDRAAATWNRAYITSQKIAGFGQEYPFVRAASGNTQAAGQWQTNWIAGPGGNNYTAIPSASAPDRTNANALNFGMMDPPSGTTAALLRIEYASLTASAAPQGQTMVWWFDLVLEAGNISTTTHTAQTLTTPALTRYTDGAGLKIALDCTSGDSGSTGAVTVSYTNTAGTSGQSTQSITVTSPNPTTLICATYSNDPPWLPLASGDTGVKAVASVTIGSGLTGGVVALNVIKPLRLMAGGQVANIMKSDDFTTMPVALPTTSGGKLGAFGCYLLSFGTDPGQIQGTFSTVFG